MRPLPQLAAVAVAAVLLAGCGSASSSSTSGAANPNAPEVSPAGDIPDNQAYVAYTPPGGRYSVKVPEGWARTRVPGGASFTDKLNSITMQARAVAGTPSAATARTAEVATLRRTVRGLRLRSVSTVSRPAGRALRITYLAPSAADAVTGRTHIDAVERYVFLHGHRAIVLTLSGPKGADNVDPWKLVTGSLRFTR